MSLNAKTVSSPESSIGLTNDLSERLASDKDFQELSICVYSFINKVKETQSGVLLQKIVLRTATNEDVLNLAKKLSYASKEELYIFFRKLSLLQSKIQETFPEIAGNVSTKKEIESAALQVVSFKFKPEHTTGDCWAAWMSGLSLCTQGCAYGNDYDNCFWACSAAWSSFAGWCFLEAD